MRLRLIVVGRGFFALSEEAPYAASTPNGIAASQATHASYGRRATHSSLLPPKQ
ncbi:hypothetical protein SAMN04488693_1312 [Arthrobacter subterraneus]|uniref:Uncharacterized protein n=1 Tax=Arthrobacter subterraneus TaxID=335973 RepID=A0A1G8P921_9MICC|nr:hypothetical protein SAMN04488693_1312 [Arthrobacter subterraneus]